MFKPTSRKKIVPAVRPIAAWIVAAALLAAAGVLGSATLRTRSKGAGAHDAAALRVPVTVKQSALVRASLATQPLAFEANQGQTDPRVKYMARGSGYTAFFTASDTVFALHSSSSATARISRNQPPSEADQKSAKKNQTAAVRMRLLDSSPHPRITADSQMPGRSNYFIGNDPSRWHANVPQYARISYRDVYPGISMAYYGAQKQLEFDFIVAPGASPAPIRLGFSGAQRIASDKAGNLILSSSNGKMLLHKPIAYQQKDGSRQPVDARFLLQAGNQVTFKLANYDHTRELVIDPSVSYATYLGGSAEDDAYGIAINGGDAYVTGKTASTDFPGTTSGHVGGFDVFVSKISPDGSSLLYSTYVGGSGDDSGNAIAVDASGNAFVTGGTASTDLPVTPSAYQKTIKSGSGGFDAFVFELAASGGSLTYCTYLGGATGNDIASGIALATDNSGDVIVVGATTSTDFPTNPIGGIPGTVGGGFVTKLNSTGSALVYSTYLGGGIGDFASAIALDSSDNAYVTGATQSPTFLTTSTAFQKTCGTAANCNGGLTDAFVSVIKADGSGFIYSTFLGGGNSDEGLGITVDSAGDAYVTGLTQSSDFPRKNPIHSSLGGLQDAFVTELDPTGSTLVYSTYLGGSNSDGGAGIAIDANKNVYVVGQTASTDFPVSSNATQSKLGGGNDAFVAEINSAGSQITFATFLGGSLNENSRSSGSNFSPVGAIAVDGAGANLYIAGNTGSSDFPITQGVKQSTFGGGSFDAFVAKYSLSSTTGGSFTVTNGALSATSGSPGVSATATITVTSVSGFNAAVSLACSVAPVVSKGPTCSFSNPGSSVTPPANGTATATLNVATTAASAMLEHPVLPSGLYYAMLLPVGGITILGAGLGSSARRRRKLLGFVMLGLVLTALLLLPACSSSKSSTGGNPGTPPGTYTITVTGTSGSTVTGTPALTLTVN